MAFYRDHHNKTPILASLELDKDMPFQKEHKADELQVVLVTANQLSFQKVSNCSIVWHFIWLN